ncbi:MAG TPA: N-6 DNA methylase [Candidatus Brocadiia bacterium]|nr:N-6 DNA methylase [Candidatus Brocadiia bacterium]
MGKTFEQGREAIEKLCQYYSTNREKFLEPGVKEAHVRLNLIDPLFEALGWDVGNAAMVAPQYRDVVTEDSLDVEGHHKAPDYTFRVGESRKFYAEAKKCSIDIEATPEPAYQVRRYGWNGKLAVSVLTNFDQLAVYDCTIPPKPKDKASRARIMFFHFEEYPERWQELWNVLSKEAVWSGAFDQLATSKRKRGTSEVDEEFLKELERWRDELARHIALRNPDISSDDLNTAVHRTIDRVVFLRMAEDRGIEPYEQLLKLCEQPDIYSRFMKILCRKADDRYNSGLFHFRREDGISEAPDRITPTLVVDDKVFKLILESLYFIHGSPYHFGVMPVEILGTVYERFLGKVIRLTEGHRAKVEEKPEVRKAGGVYYTPSYIVDYIVKQTVGRQIEGCSPAQLAGGRGKATFRVLDMACGSGSLLLGAYQLLLDHCLKWYVEHKPERHVSAVYKDPRNGQWRLTIEEKKRILTTHIFGVDIDPQAVEVSKLSLLLKALEGESDVSISRQLELFHNRALPNLSDNIKCGNSLIGPDYFHGKLNLDLGEMKRVNPFDWKREFPGAFKDGGFDCVIGNPPYGSNISPERLDYLESKYNLMRAFPDYYVAFVEAAHGRLRKRGRFGYIIPSAWLGGPAYTSLREFILGFTIESVILLPFDVFKDAYIDTVLLTTRKLQPEKNHEVNVHEYPKRGALTLIDQEVFKDSNIKQAYWEGHENRKFVLNPGILSLLCHMRQNIPNRFGDAVSMVRGVLFDSSLLTEKRISDHSHPYFEGDVYRYRINFNAPRWIEFGENMQECPKELHWFQGPRLLLRRLVNRQQRMMAAPIDETVITNKNLYVIKPKGRESLAYVLGLLNSKLISRLYLAQVSQAAKDDFPQVTIRDCLALPYRCISPDKKRDLAKRNKMEALVGLLINTYKQYAVTRSITEKQIIQRQIDSTDAEIDRLVYELYDLTDEEIAIVESGGEA